MWEVLKGLSCHVRSHSQNTKTLPVWSSPQSRQTVASRFHWEGQRRAVYCRCHAAFCLESESYYSYFAFRLWIRLRCWIPACILDVDPESRSHLGSCCSVSESQHAHWPRSGGIVLDVKPGTVWALHNLPQKPSCCSQQELHFLRGSSGKNLIQERLSPPRTSSNPSV